MHYTLVSKESGEKGTLVVGNGHRPADRGDISERAGSFSFCQIPEQLGYGRMIDKGLKSHHRPETHGPVLRLDAVELEALQINQLERSRLTGGVQARPTAEEDGINAVPPQKI